MSFLGVNHYLKAIAQSNKWQTSSQLQMGKWMKISNSPKTWQFAIHSTSVCKAPISFIDPTTSLILQASTFYLQETNISSPSKCGIFYCEGRVRSIVANCVCKLFQVTRLSCLMQEKFIHIRSLFKMTTFFEFVVQC